MSYAQQFPRPFRILAVFVLASGVVGLWLSSMAAPPAFSVQLLLLLLATVLSENYQLDLPRYSVSLAYPLTVASVILAGPTTGALVAAFSAINLKDVKAHIAPSAMAFNLGELVLVTLAAGWAYILMGGRLLLGGGSLAEGFPLTAADFPAVLVPLAALAAICALGNVALTAVAISAMRKQSIRQSFSGVAWLIPSQVALAFVGYLIAQAMAVSMLALPLFIAPLVVARQFYQRYAGLKAAYADTVRSLVGALEAKDPYTRGHSERVADYALQIGRTYGLDSRSLERLEYAALLHDLGKLAVPGSVLTKPGRLGDDETVFIRDHPKRGADMVSRVPPLRDLALTVHTHHEWYDGHGYPDGLAGEEITEMARVLSVADCYDAMTTTRAYRVAMSRDDAVAELISYAGSQFDPDVVRAFIEARVEAPVSESETLDSASLESWQAVPGSGH